MATELNLNALNWVTLACSSCGSSVEVLAEDLQLARSIRCPGCGEDIADGSDSPVDDGAGEGEPQVMPSSTFRSVPSPLAGEGGRRPDEGDRLTLENRVSGRPAAKYSIF